MDKDTSSVSDNQPFTTGAKVTKDAFLQNILSSNADTEEVESPPPFTMPEASDSERSEDREKVSPIRQVIADKLLETQQQTAMLTTFDEVDMTTIIELCCKYQEDFLARYDTTLNFTPFFIKAAVSALKTWSALNSYVDDGEIVCRKYYDIGIAVNADRHIIVPVLRGCDKLSFYEIEKYIDSYTEKAKDGNISVEDLQGGGFTITNSGIYGSLLSTPIINPPQAGTLAMHKIAKRPVVIDDKIVIRPMMFLALTYDHCVVDGREAVSFLSHIKNALEDPSRLLLDINI